MCSKFLGHGPTRGLFVRKVYGQSVVNTFLETRQRKDFARAQAEIALVLEQYFSANVDPRENPYGVESVPQPQPFQKASAADSQ